MGWRDCAAGVAGVARLRFHVRAVERRTPVAVMISTTIIAVSLPIPSVVAFSADAALYSEVLFHLCRVGQQYQRKPNGDFIQT